MAVRLSKGRVSSGLLIVSLMVFFAAPGPQAAGLIDQPGGRTAAGPVRTPAGGAVAAPAMLGIAFQARLSQEGGGQGGQAYSLADAMRDAIWRKQTAVKLKSLTTEVKLTPPTAAYGGCAQAGPGGDARRGALWAGLGASC